MEKKRNKEKPATIAVRLWTHSQAMKAVPYLRAVVGSLRENWLQVRQARLQLQRMDARPGRLERHERFLREEVDRDADFAQEQLEEAIHELAAMDVYSIDPARGFALVPFQQGKDLAWYVFDLFDSDGIATWRFDSDPPETRRPIAEEYELERSPALRAAEVDALMSDAAEASGEWPATRA